MSTITGYKIVPRSKRGTLAALMERLRTVAILLFSKRAIVVTLSYDEDRNYHAEIAWFNMNWPSWGHIVCEIVEGEYESEIVKEHLRKISEGT